MKRYEVHGVCMVPSECILVVDADSPEDAYRKAFQLPWQGEVEDGDTRAAYEWEPSVREVPKDTPLKPNPAYLTHRKQ